MAEKNAMLVMRDVSKTFNPGTVNEKCALKKSESHLKAGGFCNDRRKQRSRKINAV